MHSVRVALFYTANSDLNECAGMNSSSFLAVPNAVTTDSSMAIVPI